MYIIYYYIHNVGKNKFSFFLGHNVNTTVGYQPTTQSEIPTGR